MVRDPSVARMLRRVLCGHGVVDVGRAVGVLFNRNRNRNRNRDFALAGVAPDFADFADFADFS